MPPKKRYKLGNILRGHFIGEYHTVAEAWKDLCEWFDAGFGEKNVSPRKVFLYAFEENRYGIKQYLCCRVGFTPGKFVKKGKSALVKMDVETERETTDIEIESDEKS